MGLFDDLWDATTVGSRQQATQSRALADEFKLYQSTNNPEEKARILAGIHRNPQFAKLQERMNASLGSGQKPASVVDPVTAARNEGAALLSPEQKTALVTNPRSYARSEVTEEERRAKLAEGYARIGNVSSDKELTAAANAKARALLFGGTSEKDPKIDPAALLTGNLKGKPQETERAGERRLLHPSTWFGDDTISMGTAGKGVKKTVNELVRDYGYSRDEAITVVQDEYDAKQSGEKFRKYLPEGIMDVRSLFSGGNEFEHMTNPPLSEAEPKGGMPDTGATDRRPMFSEGVNAYGGMVGPTSPKSDAVRVSPGRKPKDVSEFLQTGTELSPLDNVPKPSSEILGPDATKETAVQYAEVKAFIESARKRGELQGFDLERSYQENPQSFATLFKAMRNGVPDRQGGTRQLTKKEWLEALRSMGR